VFFIHKVNKTDNLYSVMTLTKQL